jgi:hypothetical protein
MVESHFVNDLREIVLKKIHPSQTGFIPGQTIFVNLDRAIRSIKKATDSQRRKYGVFTNAYNTVNRDRLFDIIQTEAYGLAPNKAEYLRALYQRCKITMGSHSFIPRTGVAQGSILSPHLFDIYFDGPLREIIKTFGLDQEDILAFADDLLILLDSPHQVDIVTKGLASIFESWDLKLNVSKSAIVEFKPRMKRSPVIKDTHVNEFPVKPSYKYLGLILNRNLTLDDQLAHINRKSTFIRNKLYPFLKDTAVDSRINMWTCFIRPLTEFLLPLLSIEDTKTHKESCMRTIRRTFKAFCALKSTTRTDWVLKLLGYSPESRIDSCHKIAIRKWRSRLIGKEADKHEMDEWEGITASKVHGSFITWINMPTKLCGKCERKEIATVRHIREIHNIPIPDPLEWLTLHQGYCQSNPQFEKNRRLRLDYSRNIILMHIDSIKDLF